MLTLGYTCYMKLSKNIVLNPKDGNRLYFYSYRSFWSLLQAAKFYLYAGIWIE